MSLFEPLRLWLGSGSCQASLGKHSIAPLAPATFDALPAWLAALPPARRADIIVADGWVRYLLVAWPASLGQADEQEGYARLKLKETFGADVARWPLRLTPPRRGEECGLACALPPPLLETLTAWADGRGTRLGRIRPAWIASLQDQRRHLDNNGGLALASDDRLTIGLWTHRGWRALRSLPFGGATSAIELARWFDALDLPADGTLHCLGWQAPPRLGAWSCQQLAESRP